jgi:hypothetical protein
MRTIERKALVARQTSEESRQQAAPDEIPRGEGDSLESAAHLEPAEDDDERADHCLHGRHLELVPTEAVGGKRWQTREERQEARSRDGGEGGRHAESTDDPPVRPSPDEGELEDVVCEGRSEHRAQPSTVPSPKPENSVTRT